MEQQDQYTPEELSELIRDSVRNSRFRVHTRWQGKRVILRSKKLILWYRVWNGQATLYQVETDRGPVEITRELRKLIKDNIPQECVHHYSSLYDDEDCEDTFVVTAGLSDRKKKKRR